MSHTRHPLIIVHHNYRHQSNRFASIFRSLALVGRLRGVGVPWALAVLQQRPYLPNVSLLGDTLLAAAVQAGHFPLGGNDSSLPKTFTGDHSHFRVCAPNLHFCLQIKAGLVLIV